MKISENPFERWDLDPRDGEAELTRTMRARTRALKGDDREALQHDWRRLSTDPVFRARSTLLTPPPATRDRDLWAAAKRLLLPTPAPELPPLRADVEDALVLPRLDDEELFADPPFLPDSSGGGPS